MKYNYIVTGHLENNDERMNTEILDYCKTEEEAKEKLTKFEKENKFSNLEICEIKKIELKRCSKC